MFIDVITRKEDIMSEKVKNHIIVVFDVFLATTTIATALEAGALKVYTTATPDQGKKLSKEIGSDQCYLAGEKKGKVIDGFQSPWPLSIRNKVRDKNLILCSTNGTVAIDRCQQGKHIYTSSLINNASVAYYVANRHREEEKLTLVCAGSNGHFSLEDFVGVGSFINYYLKRSNRKIRLSDCAKASYHLFLSQDENIFSFLQTSAVGRQLIKGGLMNDLVYASTQDISHIIPTYKDSSFQGLF
ncbi:2-phosphosulfolactate phosphatase [Bacillaceae bacterium S4-13-56]